MNYLQLLNYHMANNAELTVCAVRVPAEQAANALGVLEVDGNFRMVGFEEKPEIPKTIPGSPGMALGSMGVYMFTVSGLREALNYDGDDFGHDIIPQMIKNDRSVFVYDFATHNSIADFIVQYKQGRRETMLVEKTRDSSYWRDVGTIDAYYEANMDLIDILSIFMELNGL